MPEILASLDDIQTHLPVDKLEVEDTLVDLLQIDVNRTIRGYLSGVYEPATLAAWDDPDDTPGIIRGIAGRLIAAAYYAKRYAEDDPDVPQYAQRLYNEAMATLVGVQSGRIILEEVTTEVTGDNLTREDFWPNDDTEGPLFKVGDVFG
jgi:hypothetical protein